MCAILGEEATCCADASPEYVCEEDADGLWTMLANQRSPTVFCEQALPADPSEPLATKFSQARVMNQFSALRLVFGVPSRRDLALG